MAVVNRVRGAVPPLRQLGLGLFLKDRAYGSAAAAQLQYDYDYEDYGGELYCNGRYGLAVEKTEGSVVGRGVQWVILGDPVVKRHVYAERLSKLLEVPHISMGTIVRQELQPRSSLYKQIADAVNQGNLVPDEVILALLSRRLAEGYNQGETGFILDGFPRTRLQAEILDQMADIDLVVNLKCKEDYFVKHHPSSPSQEFARMGSIGLNAALHLQDSCMKSSCVDSGGAWKEKLGIYAEQIKTLEDHYNRQKKLLDFHVSAAPGETWQSLLAALHLQHMHDTTSAPKLTA